MTLTKHLIASAALLGSLDFISACSAASDTRAGTETDTTEAVAPVSYQTADFAIENMTCASCPITVRKAMERVPGVQSVKVDFETKIATVEYDPALSTPADIAAAPTGNGYPATLIEG